MCEALEKEWIHTKESNNIDSRNFQESRNTKSIKK